MKKIIIFAVVIISVSLSVFFLANKKIFIYSRDSQISVKLGRNKDVLNLLGVKPFSKPFVILVEVMADMPDKNKLVIYVPPNDNSSEINLGCSFNVSKSSTVKIKFYVRKSYLDISDKQTDTDIAGSPDYLLLNCIDKAITGKLDENKMSEFYNYLSNGNILIINSKSK